MTLSPYPDAGLAPEHLDGAYAGLLAVLAQDEPEALRRAVQTLEADADREASAGTAATGAARLGRAWLGLSRRPGEHVDADGQQEHVFSYPAHAVFQVRAASVRAARRQARRAVDALLSSDAPLGSISGPLPPEPALSDVVVWLGSLGEEKDRLDLELVGE